MNNFVQYGSPKKIIMDPVHGGIPIYPHEEHVINSPLFQRLNHIRQNDILFMVFPGATHSRFSHSIGAMHIAGRLFSALTTSYIDTFDTLNKEEIEALTYAVTYINYCLRLAVLLHDTGHGPFSHLFERCEIIEKELSKSSTFNSLWKGVDWSKYYTTQPEKLKHEDYSLRCAVDILEKLKRKKLLPVEVDDVISIMENSIISPTKQLIQHSKILLKLVNIRIEELNLDRKHKLNCGIKVKRLSEEILHFCSRILSGEVDADKMDYLLRDSFFSGCNYGEYNIDHLINSLCIGFDMANNKDPWIGLAIREKGLSALENFVHSRFQLYLNLYNHKTVVGFKWLFEKSMQEIFGKASSNNFKVARQALNDINNFTYFTDEFIWRKLQEHASSKPNSYSYKLINRAKLDYLYSGNNLDDYEKEIRASELKEEYPIEEIIYSEAPSKFSKFSQINQDNIRLYVEKHRTKGTKSYKHRILMSVLRKTDFFLKFHDVKVTHFYIEPSTTVSRRNKKAA